MAGWVEGNTPTWVNPPLAPARSNRGSSSRWGRPGSVLRALISTHPAEMVFPRALSTTSAVSDTPFPRSAGAMESSVPSFNRTSTEAPCSGCPGENRVTSGKRILIVDRLLRRHTAHRPRFGLGRLSERVKSKQERFDERKDDGRGPKPRTQTGISGRWVFSGHPIGGRRSRV